ncbi:TPA: hypothetical protein ACH3X1_013328 [Trebouxia sp. C0004]
MLWWRAFWKHGKKDADAALITRDKFVQVSKAYLGMLCKMYGDELVMRPYIMSVDALNAQDTTGAEALSNFRVLQKRFVVYQPSKVAPRSTAARGQPQSGHEQIMENSSSHQPGHDQQATSNSSDSADVDIMGMEELDKC